MRQLKKHWKTINENDHTVMKLQDDRPSFEIALGP